MPFNARLIRQMSVRHRLARSLVLVICLSFIPLSSVVAGHTPNPTSVVIGGSLQSELGCSGDWDPACAISGLTFDSFDDVWQEVFNIPAGDWEYKAALNQSWDENYGLNAQENGSNITLSLAALTSVKFYYDHKSHWITDNQTSIIAVAPGDFQSELGCPGDWDPGCLRSWLQDPDGDGVYTFTTTLIPAGDYQTKVAIDESWDENYGAGGTPDGDNILFTVPANATVTFTYNSITHVLEISFGPVVAAPEVSPSPSDEGDSVVASATFTSPGVGPYNCTVDYGDGSGPLAGTIVGTTCTGPNHIYVDDSPSGTYSVTVEVTDEDTGTGSNSVQHTVNNLPPTIVGITTNGPVPQGQQVTVTVDATDAGANDVLSFRFDCDNNGSYETAGIANQGQCTLAAAAATSTIGVQVSDDDLGVTTGSVQVDQTVTLCASRITGALSAALGGNCPTGAVNLTLPALQPTVLCINRYTGHISWIPGGCPSTGWRMHVVPNDGPLNYCASRWTGGLRAIFGAQECTIYEVPGVIPG